MQARLYVGIENYPPSIEGARRSVNDYWERLQAEQPPPDACANLNSGLHAWREFLLSPSSRIRSFKEALRVRRGTCVNRAELVHHLVAPLDGLTQEVEIGLSSLADRSGRVQIHSEIHVTTDHCSFQAGTLLADQIPPAIPGVIREMCGVTPDALEKTKRATDEYFEYIDRIALPPEHAFPLLHTVAKVRRAQATGNNTKAAETLVKDGALYPRFAHVDPSILPVGEEFAMHTADALRPLGDPAYTSAQDMRATVMDTLHATFEQATHEAPDTPPATDQENHLPWYERQPFIGSAALHAATVEVLDEVFASPRKFGNLRHRWQANATALAEAGI